MKYLVNRETKNHVAYDENDARCEPGIRSGYWRIVDADEDGWIGWFPDHATVCPLPAGQVVEVRLRGGIGPLRNTAHFFTWHTVASQSGPKDIEFYRPVLGVGSKPALEETWHKINQDSKVDVFTRLAAAVTASESIPALIAEINAMLPEGYELREKAKTEQPAEDMNDWRNWRAGDIVTCINGHGWTSFVLGGTYPVTGVYESGVFINESPISKNIQDFKFHSRPEAK